MSVTVIDEQGPITRREIIAAVPGRMIKVQRIFLSSEGQGPASAGQVDLTDSDPMKPDPVDPNELFVWYTSGQPQTLALGPKDLAKFWTEPGCGVAIVYDSTNHLFAKIDWYVEGEEPT